MKKFFLKHCTLYRRLIRKFFGKSHVHTLEIPSAIYGDFNVCYLGYDDNGYVKKGFKNIFEALRNRGDLGLTVLYERY